VLEFTLRSWAQQYSTIALIAQQLQTTPAILHQDTPTLIQILTKILLSTLTSKWEPLSLIDRTWLVNSGRTTETKLRFNDPASVVLIQTKKRRSKMFWDSCLKRSCLKFCRCVPIINLPLINAKLVARPKLVRKSCGLGIASDQRLLRVIK